MTPVRPVVAQCLAGSRPQPFIAEQASRVPGFSSIALARGPIDPSGWDGVPIIRVGPGPGWAKPDFMEPGPDFDNVPEDFQQAMRQHGAQLLHAHHGMFALDFMSLAAVTQLPLVVSFYGYDASGFPRSSSANARRLERLFAASTSVLAMSADMGRDLIAWGCPEERVVIHAPAVNTTRFTGPPERTKVDMPELLCVCDFSAKKGVPTLLQAIQRVVQAYPKVRLRLVGTPISTAQANYKTAVNVARALDLERHLTWHGWVDYARVPEVYQTAGIFVLACEQAPDGSKEGVPAAILEAMASGLPVISTYHAGIPDVVRTGDTGLLVQEHNPSQLADALMDLLASPERRVEMGSAGQERARQFFDCDRQATRLDTIYSAAMGSVR